MVTFTDASNNASATVKGPKWIFMARIDIVVRINKISNTVQLAESLDT